MATSCTDLSWGYVLEWRWTTLHSLLSMWWDLQCLQEWNQRCIFGLLWHMFTCYRDLAMIVSMKHIKCYKLFKRLDKQVSAPANEIHLKKKGALQEQVHSGLKMKSAPLLTQLCRHEAWIFLLQPKSSLLNTSNPEPSSVQLECISWSKQCFFPSRKQSRLLSISVWSSSTLGPSS